LERKIGNAELSTSSNRRPLLSSIKVAVLDALSTLPDGDRICHGDFHPGNILLTTGRTVVIDWIDASLGNPLADVARTTIIALGAAASSQIPNSALSIIVRLFHSAYLHNYFQLRPGGEEEYRRWLPVIAAARLSENIPELEHWLLQQAEKVL
jgi:aminoglycoside phosphotransferase (APT) family kinase protein